MKKILSAILVCVMLLSCVLVLASCGKKLSGTYTDETGIVSYTFKGKKVEVEAFGATQEATYKIDGDTITFTVEIGGQEVEEESSFEQGKDDNGKYIEIDGVKLYKK